jgi:hypothetical protein
MADTPTPTPPEKQPLTSNSEQSPQPAEQSQIGPPESQMRPSQTPSLTQSVTPGRKPLFRS